MDFMQKCNIWRRLWNLNRTAMVSNMQNKNWKLRERSLFNEGCQHSFCCLLSFVIHEWQLYDLVFDNLLHFCLTRSWVSQSSHAFKCEQIQLMHLWMNRLTSIVTMHRWKLKLNNTKRSNLNKIEMDQISFRRLKARK